MIDATRIAYVGDSLGAMEGAIAAALEPEVKAWTLNVVGGGLFPELAAHSPSISGSLVLAGGFNFGFQGNTLTFARDRWTWLVGATRSLSSGSIAMPFRGLRSSGNHAFDAWRETEFARIEAERSKLRAAEREFAAYHDELMHAKDSEDFDRFMRARSESRA